MKAAGITKEPGNKTLETLGKGSLFIFAGNIIHLFLNFFSMGIITRYLDKEEFGYISLALAIVNIMLSFTCLGFDKSLPPYIAEKKEKKDFYGIDGSIMVSLCYTTVASIVLSIAIYLFSNEISLILKKDGFGHVLRLFAIILPLLTLITINVAYLQSFHNIWGKIFNDTFIPFFRVMFLVTVVVLHLSFTHILWCYVLSHLIVTVLICVYAVKKLPVRLKIKSLFSKSMEFVYYSFPLFVSGILAVVLTWTGVILMGYFQSADEVGVFNAGVRLTRLLRLLYMSTGFIFIPLAAQLYFKKEMKELQLMYATITKWLVVMTFPFFFFFLMAPDVSMSFFFGQKYVGHNEFLQILSIGFFFHVVAGHSESALIAFGKTNLLMWCLVITLISNLVLSIILIPLYGKLGAACAYSLAILIDNIIAVGCVYKYSGVHPFSRDYTQMLVIMIGVTAVVWGNQVFGLFEVNTWQMLLLALFTGPVIISISRNYSEGDLLLFKMMQQKIMNKLRGSC